MVGDDAEVRIVVGDVEAVADDVVVVGEFVVAVSAPELAPRRGIGEIVHAEVVESWQPPEESPARILPRVVQARDGGVLDLVEELVANHWAPPTTARSVRLSSRSLSR